MTLSCLRPSIGKRSSDEQWAHIRKAFCYCRRAGIEREKRLIVVSDRESEGTLGLLYIYCNVFDQRKIDHPNRWFYGNQGEYQRTSRQLEAMAIGVGECWYMTIHGSWGWTVPGSATRRLRTVLAQFFSRLQLEVPFGGMHGTEYWMMISGHGWHGVMTSGRVMMLTYSTEVNNSLSSSSSSSSPRNLYPQVEESTQSTRRPTIPPCHQSTTHPLAAFLLPTGDANLQSL